MCCPQAIGWPEINSRIQQQGILPPQLVIGLIGCLEGFKCKSNAQSVGEHTTSSVVQSISLVILLAGSLAIVALPTAQYPNITPPTITVTCTYTGASAQVVADTARRIGR